MSEAHGGGRATAREPNADGFGAQPREMTILETERRGAVLIATLNRPEARNALDPELMRAIGEAILDAESDADIRALVLTAAGDRVFCAGMDLRAFAEGRTPGDDEGTRAFMRLLRGEVGLPMVAAANGSALAGGFELLLGCDLIVLAEGAVLGLPEVKRGLFAAGGGTFLATRIPLAVALELTLTGDTVDGARALSMGLVNAVVPAGEVLDTALALAERIAANGPLAVHATKELVRLATVDGRRAGERLRELQPVVFGSEDAREGALAFVEKRDPVWKGR